jgi:hypothetical protein
MTRTDDDDVSGIICRVWPNGCGHPELCQDECFDVDLVSPVMPTAVWPRPASAKPPSLMRCTRRHRFP